MGRRLAETLRVSFQPCRIPPDPLALVAVPTPCCPSSVQKYPYSGEVGSHVSGPQFRTPPLWALWPHPSLSQWLGLPGGAPASLCDPASPAALHQLGGFRDLFCEPAARSGGLPNEPQQLPELLDGADGYAGPSHTLLFLDGTEQDPEKGSLSPVQVD